MVVLLVLLGAVCGVPYSNARTTILILNQAAVAADHKEAKNPWLCVVAGELAVVVLVSYLAGVVVYGCCVLLL